MSAIDRESGFEELILVPIYGPYACVGAATFFSVMCYPEDTLKREKFCEAMLARVIKQGTAPRSPERAQLRQAPGIRRLIAIPNKRIDQTFNSGLRRLHSRLRASWVLMQKLASNEDPAKQLPLRDLMLKAAIQNTRNYPGFGSSDGDEEQIISSFRRRVMTPSRPVAHLAMAFYDLFNQQNDMKLGLPNLILDAENWLAETVEKAEIFRVSFGDLFPNRESSHLPTRAQNYYVPPQQMLAVLPYIETIESEADIYKLKTLQSQYNK